MRSETFTPPPSISRITWWANLAKKPIYGYIYVRHTNNSLCYFRKLHPFVQHRLFQAYFTSLYGCKLWLLNNCNIEALCLAWQKTLRRIWNLSSCTHSRLLPLICNCLPLFDEICRRSLHFICTCALHDSSLIRFVVLLCSMLRYMLTVSQF